MTRIGTWNMDTQPSSPKELARRSDRMEFIERADCDVWLLTEVPLAFAMGGRTPIFSERMGTSDEKAYAAVWARDGVEELDAVHPAAAYAIVGELRVCSCVLPWFSAPWQGWPVEGDYETIVAEAIGRLSEGLMDGPGDLVLGGDWNHALEGEDRVGRPAGLMALLALRDTLDLTVPTAGLDKYNPKGPHCSIDHIAIPSRWKSVAPEPPLVAETEDGKRLSDHDAYVVHVGGQRTM